MVNAHKNQAREIKLIETSKNFRAQLQKLFSKNIGSLFVPQRRRDFPTSPCLVGLLIYIILINVSLFESLDKYNKAISKIL